MLCLNGDMSSKNYLIGPQNPTAILLQFTLQNQEHAEIPKKTLKNDVMR